MDPFIGEIRPFAGNFAPVNWHLCDGTLLPIQNNETLYALIGTTYGGDGVNTFAVPDLRGRLPIGNGQGTGLSNRNLGDKGGNESVTLSTGNVPAHSHPMMVTTAAATDNSPAGKLFANPAPNLFYGTTPTTGSPAQTLAADTVPPSGGGNQAHENRMPSMAISYIICQVGIYPQHP